MPQGDDDAKRIFAAGFMAAMRRRELGYSDFEIDDEFRKWQFADMMQFRYKTRCYFKLRERSRSDSGKRMLAHYDVYPLDSERVGKVFLSYSIPVEYNLPTHFIDEAVVEPFTHPTHGVLEWDRVIVNVKRWESYA